MPSSAQLKLSTYYLVASKLILRLFNMLTYQLVANMASFKPRGVVAGGWELPYSYLSPAELGNYQKFRETNRLKC